MAVCPHFLKISNDCYLLTIVESLILKSKLKKKKKNYAILFQGQDLDYKIQEFKEAGKTFPESQIIEWFIQLLLGVDYMHERYVY